MKKKEYKIILDKGEIRERAIDILTSQGYECWRQNNFAVRGRKFIGRKGVPDIIGYMKVSGLIMGCEVKTIGDRLNEDQIAFLRLLKFSSGLAFLATQNTEGIVSVEPFSMPVTKKVESLLNKKIR